MTKESKPLAITMGCPVGIGPEIILKSFASGVYDGEPARPVVIGDPGVLSWCGRILGLPAPVVAWQPGEEPARGTIPVFAPDDLPDLDISRLKWGEPDQGTGRAMAVCIEAAVKAVLQEMVGGMVTCPITKKALNQAGYRFPGHTEMLASLCRTDRYAMMMAGRRLRVTLVTIHTPLRAVADALNHQAIFELIRMTARSLKHDFALPRPRIAVAGLNPHAGEDGLFGREEVEVIRPAVEAAGAAGWQASGPYPPDTVFHRAASGAYDAVVCMYHDQGLIPFKLLHFADGVNVTIGLPIVRTSVDHGTAYDIAGQGKADPASLIAAVRMAGEIAKNRARRAS